MRPVRCHFCRETFDRRPGRGGYAARCAECGPGITDVFVCLNCLHAMDGAPRSHATMAKALRQWGHTKSLEAFKPDDGLNPSTTIPRKVNIPPVNIGTGEIA